MTIFSTGQYQSRSGCLNARTIIAVVIALAGVITYLGRTQINPVTGEKQHIAMTADQEMALGLQAAPQMMQQMGGAIDPATSPEAALVSQIGQKLIQSNETLRDSSKDPYAQNFHFFLLADPQTVNAFALPGGQVFITRALLERLETEAQLAGVLGHEVGHVINRHAAEHMAKGQLGGMLATAVGVGASDRRDGYSAAIAAQMVNQMFQLRFSRSDELEADNFGLRYMTAASYDPAAMLRVMEILKQASAGGRGPSFLQTHPDPDARIAAINAYLQKTYPNGVPSNLSEGRKLSF